MKSTFSTSITRRLLNCEFMNRYCFGKKRESRDVVIEASKVI